MYPTKRSRVTVAALVALIMCICTNAWCLTFDDILRGFAQRRSGVCVIYGHAMAMAEHNPEAFAKLVRQAGPIWSVKLNGYKWAYVTHDEIDKSVKAGFSCGETDNLLTIYSMAVSKRCNGYNYETGQLDYGDGWMELVGTGKWTLYDDGQVEGQHLKDGLDRLVREAGPDGKPKTPSTMGFGNFDKKTIPNHLEQVQKIKLLGGHDYSVSRYDAERKIVLLRNPHNPKEFIEAPMDLLLSIPSGIDFMEVSDS